MSGRRLFVLDAGDEPTKRIRPPRRRTRSIHYVAAAILIGVAVAYGVAIGACEITKGTWR